MYCGLNFCGTKTSSRPFEFLKPKELWNEEFIMAIRILGILAFICCASLVSPASSATMIAGDKIYRLDEQATFQVDCGQAASVRGALVLGPAMVGDVVDFHEVTDIYWRVFGNDGTAAHVITGTGSYMITNFGPPQQHALGLELSIDGGAPQLFFSDFVDVPNDGSFDFVLTTTGDPCDGIAIRVDASVAPRRAVTTYGLKVGSTFQEGCFNEPGCMPQDPRPLTGSFKRVTLVENGVYAEYAIVKINFDVPDENGHPAISIVGNGAYTLIQGFAGPIQEMDLRLSVNGQPLADFDHELENVDPIFPNIDIVVDMNEQMGEDVALTMLARPLRVGSFLGL
jgi:hypothetical protein